MCILPLSLFAQKSLQQPISHTKSIAWKARLAMFQMKQKESARCHAHCAGCDGNEASLAGGYAAEIPHCKGIITTPSPPRISTRIVTQLMCSWWYKWQWHTWILDTWNPLLPTKMADETACIRAFCCAERSIPCWLISLLCLGLGIQKANVNCRTASRAHSDDDQHDDHPMTIWMVYRSKTLVNLLLLCPCNRVDSVALLLAWTCWIILLVPPCTLHMSWHVLCWDQWTEGADNRHVARVLAIECLLAIHTAPAHQRMRTSPCNQILYSCWNMAPRFMCTKTLPIHIKVNLANFCANHNFHKMSQGGNHFWSSKPALRISNDKRSLTAVDHHSLPPQACQQHTSFLPSLQIIFKRVHDPAERRKFHSRHALGNNANVKLKTTRSPDGRPSRGGQIFMQLKQHESKLSSRFGGDTTKQEACAPTEKKIPFLHNHKESQWWLERAPSIQHKSLVVWLLSHWRKRAWKQSAKNSRWCITSEGIYAPKDSSIGIAVGRKNCQ